MPQGEFQLTRYPLQKNDPLRAWDAADEFILHGVADPGSIPFGSVEPPQFPEHAPTGALLIFNDAFGALAVALAPMRPMSVTDSYLAKQGADSNLISNAATRSAVEFLSPLDELRFPVATFLLKIPKTLSLLEHELHMIRSVCSADTRIIAGAMVKNVHSSTLALFEEIIGPTVTSLAQKKARLIVSSFNPDLTPNPNPWPKTVRLDSGMEVVVHAGVFAGTKLDVGTRVLLANLPKLPGAADVVDLGCGNGVLGTAMARDSRARITFTDESHLALASAESTFALNHPGREARFVTGDSGNSLETTSADLILCNPPFHASNALSDAGAWRMFTESRRILRPGGELRVVANRHLGYHVKLKKLFGNCATVASTPKFVILSTQA